MTMERSLYMQIADLDKKNAMLDAMAYNTELIGNNQFPIRINKLKLVDAYKADNDKWIGLMVLKPYSDEQWKVIKKLPNGQVLVWHEKTHEDGSRHAEIWGKNHLVRLLRVKA